MSPELTEDVNDVHSSIGASSTIGLSEAGLENGTSTFQLGTGVFTSPVRSLSRIPSCTINCLQGTLSPDSQRLAEPHL